MRCYICNAIDAEHHDPRDDKWLCYMCKDDVDAIIYEWKEEDDLEEFEDEDTSDMS